MVRRICCEITKPDFTNFTYECGENYSFLLNTSLPWILTTVMAGLIPIYMVRLLNMLISYSIFDQNHSQYHKLQESTMSPSSIFLKMIWKEQSIVISFVRWSIFLCAFSYIIHFCYKSWSALDSPVVGFCIAFIYVLVAVITLDCVQSGSEIKLENKGLEWKVTLPFNIKHLTNDNNLEGVKNFIIETPHAVSSSGNGMLRSSGQYTCYLLKLLLVLLLVCLFIPLFFIGLYIYIFTYKLPIAAIMVSCEAVGTKFDRLTWSPTRYMQNFARTICLTLFLILLCVFVIFLHYICYVLPFAIQSFLLGLFLNLISFIPYLASFYVFTFYCCTYWKSLEEKYFVLKLLIYEACRDKEENNDNVNRYLEQNEKKISVVSKELYENIRERLLPYHTNVLWIVLKILWLSMFSYGIFVLVDMLHTFNTTAVVQVVTTASVSILPKVFDMAAWKIDDAETKEAWKAELKLNVKSRGDKLTAERQELAKAVLIVKDEQLELDEYLENGNQVNRNNNIQLTPE